MTNPPKQTPVTHPNMGLRPKSRGQDPITNKDRPISHPAWRHSFWENGSLTLGHYLQRFFSPLTQLRLNRPVQSVNKSFLTDPFGPFISLNFLLTHHLKQFALGIIIPDQFNQREKRLMHNLVSSRAGSVKKLDRQSATLIPLTPLDNLPGLCTTITETEVSFLLDSGSLFNLINGPLLDLICEETSMSFPTFQHSINLKAHNGSSLPLRKKGMILPVTLDKAQNGIKGNISENWTQKWTAGPVHL